MIANEIDFESVSYRSPLASVALAGGVDARSLSVIVKLKKENEVKLVESFAD